MGDHDQRARPGVEVVLQHGEGVDVQVVGRLVQQQHVRLAEQQPQELQPPPLAAGQVVEPGGQPLAGEAEVLQQRAGTGLPTGGQPGLPAQPLDRLQHPLASRAARPRSGSGSRSRSVRPRLTVPGVRRQLAQQQPQQAGLAGAVDPDQADPRRPARSTRSGRAAAPAVRPGTVRLTPVQVEDVLAQPAGGELLQLQPVPRRRLVGDQRVGRVDPELRLRWSAPAVPGAARPAPCAAGSCAGSAIPAACRARSARASTYAA